MKTSASVLNGSAEDTTLPVSIIGATTRQAAATRCAGSGALSDLLKLTPPGWRQRQHRGRARPMLTLYDDVFSPYARKVRIALYEKGIPFERVRALHGDCNRTDFVHVNPRAEVPALIDDGFSLYDSTIICEYIEDRYPEPRLYPADPSARAKCRLAVALSMPEYSSPNSAK